VSSGAIAAAKQFVKLENSRQRCFCKTSIGFDWAASFDADLPREF
jgi:hypothetical protein